MLCMRDDVMGKEAGTGVCCGSKEATIKYADDCLG